MWKKIVSYISNVAKSFFFSQGKFQPVYFWTTVFNLLIATTWIMKLSSRTKVEISDTLLLGLLTFVVVWLGVYNWYRTKTAPENDASSSSSAAPSTGLSGMVNEVKAKIPQMMRGKIK